MDMHYVGVEPANQCANFFTRPGVPWHEKARAYHWQQATVTDGVAVCEMFRDLMSRGAQKLAFVHYHSILAAGRGGPVEIVQQENAHQKCGTGCP